jgi:hypothetical protein
MNDEPVTGQGTETPEVPEAPTDFAEYVRWRKSGELPEEKPPDAETGAHATEPQAETAPAPEPETKTQEPEVEEDESAEPAKGRGGSRQRKIDKLVRENAEIRQMLESLRAQPPAETPKASAPAETAGKPKLENFETLEAYQEALTDFKLDERERARQAQDAERQAREAAQKIQTEWSRRQRAAQQSHDDYDDVIDAVKAPEGPGVAAARQAMLEDEAGPEILYWLAKHPDDLQRIAALSPVSAVREIGKIAASVAKPPAPDNGKPRITGAPKPPPATGRPSKVTSDSLDDPEVQRDFRKYERLRLAQLKRR